MTYWAYLHQSGTSSLTCKKDLLDRVSKLLPVLDVANHRSIVTKKWFGDLKLSRGFLPVVALSDPSAGNLSPGTTSPTKSSGGGPPKGKFGKGAGKATGKKGKPNRYKYDKPLAKAAQLKQKAAAALQCRLRCGQPRHFAANCPIKSKNKRPATESMARHNEEAMVTFMDKNGTERFDIVLVDPGALGL